MKKLVFSLLSIFYISILSAQVEIKPGVKAGINSANLTNLEGFNNKNITSFHIGGTLSFKFAKFYTLQPEILYSKQGAELKNTFLDNNGIDPLLQTESLKVELDYLSIPINNKFFIGDSGFHFEIAPVIDILINDKNIEDPQGFDFGIAGGIGFEFPMGITIDVRYKQGLTDVFGRNVNDGNGYETTDISDLILNKVIQFSIAYQFNLSK